MNLEVGLCDEDKGTGTEREDIKQALLVIQPRAGVLVDNYNIQVAHILGLVTDSYPKYSCIVSLILIVFFYSLAHQEEHVFSLC